MRSKSGLKKIIFYQEADQDLNFGFDLLLIWSLFLRFF